MQRRGEDTSVLCLLAVVRARRWAKRVVADKGANGWAVGGRVRRESRQDARGLTLNGWVCAEKRETGKAGLCLRQERERDERGRDRKESERAAPYLSQNVQVTNKAKQRISHASIPFRPSPVCQRTTQTLTRRLSPAFQLFLRFPAAAQWLVVCLLYIFCAI